MTGLDDTLVALADRSRRAVIELLRRAPRRASDIADHLGASRPATSRHLRVLRKAGLVEANGDERADDARVRVYRLRPERLGELRRWLEEVEEFWEGQLASFAAHVEKRKAPKR